MATHDNSAVDDTDPNTIHVPFGHVPYVPSLPKVMGSLTDFPIDWWFYGGWAANEDDTKQFTIVLWSQRALFNGIIFYGIGVKTNSDTDGSFYTTTDMLGMCRFPTPTSTSWSTHIDATHTSMTCKLKSGTLGLRGAMYQVDLTDKTNNVQASLTLKSNVGLIEEGPACMYPGIETIQFNMPAMTILAGSTITLKGETTDLAKGNIWLDRQSIQMPSNIFKPLYIGVWIAITMNDQTSYTIQFVWSKREEKGTQWISGTEVGYPPLAKTGLEYFSLQNWDGQSPVDGVDVLGSSEFDLNILTPSDTEKSPHWQSENGNTYCTAWNLSLKGKNYKLLSLVQGCEVFLDTYFYEGAATVEDESGAVVGHVMVEQMGYN